MTPIEQWMALVGVCGLVFAVLAVVADWWESEQARDAYERSQEPRYWRPGR